MFDQNDEEVDHDHHVVVGDRGGGGGGGVILPPNDNGYREEHRAQYDVGNNVEYAEPTISPNLRSYSGNHFNK